MCSLHSVLCTFLLPLIVNFGITYRTCLVQGPIVTTLFPDLVNFMDQTLKITLAHESTTSTRSKVSMSKTPQSVKQFLCPSTDSFAVIKKALTCIYKTIKGLLAFNYI